MIMLNFRYSFLPTLLEEKAPNTVIADATSQPKEVGI